MNYFGRWPSREMEPVMINLDFDDDDSLTCTVGENENETCLAMK